MSAAMHHPLIKYQAQQPRRTARLARLTASVVDTLRLWSERFNERRAFPVLDDRELRDLRITRWELEHELGKPFWRG